MSEQQVEATVNGDTDNDLFDEQEQAALAFAQQLTRNSRVDDEVMKKLNSFLSPAQVVELTATVGLANFTNRFNEGLAIELP